MLCSPGRVLGIDQTGIRKFWFSGQGTYYLQLSIFATKVRLSGLWRLATGWMELSMQWRLPRRDQNATAEMRRFCKMRLATVQIPVSHRCICIKFEIWHPGCSQWSLCPCCHDEAQTCSKVANIFFHQWCEQLLLILLILHSKSRCIGLDYDVWFFQDISTPGWRVVICTSRLSFVKEAVLRQRQGLIPISTSISRVN